MAAPLLIEIGCEEIPARMIASAADDLRARVVTLIDQAGLPHGNARAWGGTRRLAVRVEDVAPRLADRVETVLGPPASVAFGADGRPTPAGAGFAKKQGLAPSALDKIETDKGLYAGFTREVAGRTVGEVLAAALPAAVAGMSFPKTMRWGSGAHRWVRPVHGLVALYGSEVIDMEILGARAGRVSEGHRFLAGGPVTVPHADAYVEALREAFVLVDPEARRAALTSALAAAAAEAGGRVVPDDGLLDEVQDLVEWPGVVVGRFDPSFLDLPPEILVTTLRHHQKSFSVRGKSGLLPAFLSVANTDRDPKGHVRRGNEWVVVGRLEDARFFWDEDRKRPLASRLNDLAKVTFHVKVGSYADKTASTTRLAERLASWLGLDEADRRRAQEAARLAKTDLTTGLVGEFPELQGIVGGLLLGAEDADPEVARAVYEHYRPAGADDVLPATEIACVLSVADRLDTLGSLLGAGVTPTGSRDPFGLRRAANGIFRIAIERRWVLSLEALGTFLDRPRDAAAADTLRAFALDRLHHYLRELGYSANEVSCVMLAGHGELAPTWPLHEIVARLGAISEIRGRDDFQHLVDLTKRVANIRTKNAKQVEQAAGRGGGGSDGADPQPEARVLAAAVSDVGSQVERHAAASEFTQVVARLATLVDPVDAFFDKVLVVDPENPGTTRARLRLLGSLEGVLTRHFDIRELAGQADSKR
jgi:glycyl-tRNA synthetase beta chain